MLRCAQYTEENSPSQDKILQNSKKIAIFYFHQKKGLQYREAICIMRPFLLHSRETER